MLRILSIQRLILFLIIITISLPHIDNGNFGLPWKHRLPLLIPSYHCFSPLVQNYIKARGSLEQLTSWFFIAFCIISMTCYHLFYSFTPATSSSERGKSFSIPSLIKKDCGMQVSIILYCEDMDKQNTLLLPI